MLLYADAVYFGSCCILVVSKRTPECLQALLNAVQWKVTKAGEMSFRVVLSLSAFLLFSASEV